MHDDVDLLVCAPEQLGPLVDHLLRLHVCGGRAVFLVVVVLERVHDRARRARRGQGQVGGLPLRHLRRVFDALGLLTLVPNLLGLPRETRNVVTVGLELVDVDSSTAVIVEVLEDLTQLVLCDGLSDGGSERGQPLLKVERPNFAPRGFKEGKDLVDSHAGLLRLGHDGPHFLNSSVIVLEVVLIERERVKSSQPTGLKRIKGS
mmetsp:Transcript_109811/g.319437  ORF Transcript_109811/g.319437 Transcript_109811/m.319437 type:complete len:204 (+) Transcript_109811:1801-2412(+)